MPGCTLSCECIMVSIETVSPELTVSLGDSLRIEPAPLHRLERRSERVVLAGRRSWRPVVTSSRCCGLLCDNGAAGQGGNGCGNDQTALHRGHGSPFRWWVTAILAVAGTYPKLGTRGPPPFGAAGSWQPRRRCTVSAGCGITEGDTRSESALYRGRAWAPLRSHLPTLTRMWDAGWDGDPSATRSRSMPPRRAWRLQRGWRAGPAAIGRWD